MQRHLVTRHSTICGTASARLVCLLFTVLASGCGDSSGDSSEPAACSPASQKLTVLDVMQDIYLYNDQLPDVDPNDFPTAEALLEALIVNPPDRFSSIGSAAADQMFFGAGQFIGFGLTSALLSSDDLRVAEVFEGSPADAAGLERGYRILTIDSRTIAEINAAEGVDAAFGPDEVGVQVDFGLADRQGAPLDVTVTKAVVTIPPVPITTVFDVGGEPTGYLLFRTFVDPSFDALNDAFADFAAAGVRDLIVDMRYNGGGLVAVADFLGNLLGGLDSKNGQVFSMTVFNANNAFRNTTTLFMNETNSLSLDRLIFITTGSTASASEIVINSLTPHVETFLVGDDTFGKPVGSLGFTFCEKIIRPISFETVNSDGTGDYFDGLPVDCAAEDDLDFVLGDPAEASLAEAMFVAQNGACSAVAAIAREKLAARRRKPPDGTAARDIWQLLINAH